MKRIADELRHLWQTGFPSGSPAAYLFAIVCVATASLLRYGLSLVDEGRLPFAAYYPAVLFATLLGGVGPGGFAAALSVLLMWVSVPGFGWSAQNQMVYLVVHAFASALVVWLAEGYRHIVRRLREEEEQRVFLMRELHHRSRNLLAVVQAIVNLTLRDKGEDADRINKAIGALAMADELLMKSPDHTADFRDIVAAELMPYDATRITANGGPISLVPDLSRALALVLHELATNAAKYGALSKPDGRLSVSWEAGGGRIQIRWVEQGGPSVVPPVRHGFGSHLIERLLHSFHGTFETQFQPGGVVCEISFALPSLGLPDAGT